MDLNVTPKVKIAEGEGFGACSLACSTLGVDGHARALGWELKLDVNNTSLELE